MLSSTTPNKVKEKQARQLPEQNLNLAQAMQPMEAVVPQPAPPIMGGINPMRFSDIEIPKKPRDMSQLMEMIELNRIPRPEEPEYDTPQSDKIKNIAKWNSLGKGLAGLGQALGTAFGQDTYVPDNSFESQVVGRLQRLDDDYLDNYRRYRDQIIFNDRDNTDIANREKQLNANLTQQQMDRAADAENQQLNRLREDLFRNDQLDLQRDELEQRQRNADRQFNLQSRKSTDGSGDDGLTPEERRYADYYIQKKSQELKEAMSGEDFMMLSETQQKAIADEYRDVTNPDTWNKKDYIKNAARKGSGMILDDNLRVGEQQILEGYDVSDPKGKEAAMRNLSTWYEKNYVQRGYKEDVAKDLAQADAMIRVAALANQPQLPEADSYKTKTVWEAASDFVTGGDSNPDPAFDQRVEQRRMSGLNDQLSGIMRDYQVPESIAKKYNQITRENFPKFKNDILNYAREMDKKNVDPPAKLDAFRQAGILLRDNYTQDNYSFEDAVRENLNEIERKYSINP